MSIYIFVKIHCVKYQIFTQFLALEILWKDTVSLEFRANRPKLYGNCDFQQNFHTGKLGENSVFYAVYFYKNVNFLK